MKKTYFKTTGLFVCTLLTGTFLATQVHAQKLVTFRYGEVIPETYEEALVNLTATTTAEGVTSPYFTLNSVGYEEADILYALSLGEFMSFTGDSDDPPACNSEPWKATECFASLTEPDLCESEADRTVALAHPEYGGWPCCTYEKAWMFKAELPEGSSSQLVLNGLVFDSRRLAPGTSGDKTDEMPGTTGYEIWVNGVFIGKGDLVPDNNWHNIVHAFNTPIVAGVAAEIKVKGTGAQLDDPIPWRIDNMQLLGVATSDGTYPAAAFTLEAVITQSKKPKVILEWAAPPAWTGTSGRIRINRNEVEIADVAANTTTYTDTNLPPDEEEVEVGIYEVCTSYEEGGEVVHTLCSNMATVKY